MSVSVLIMVVLVAVTAGSCGPHKYSVDNMPFKMSPIGCGPDMHFNIASLRDGTSTSTRALIIHTNRDGNSRPCLNHQHHCYTIAIKRNNETKISVCCRTSACDAYIWVVNVHSIFHGFVNVVNIN